MRRGSTNRELKHALLERLMHYYHFLCGQPGAPTPDTVTSTEIARLVHMDDTLVRKDLAAIGVRGHPRVGFRSVEVLSAIRGVLGFDTAFESVVIGAGRLGSALASYPGFASLGMGIVGLFDNAPQKVGLTCGRHVIQPMVSLPTVVRNHGVSLAILTVPPDATQEVADQAVAAGIKAIWNFASTSLTTPDDVFVRHEHISVGLAELSYQLSRMSEQ
ncbi:MAG: redox-sensing transcriptional repressor Rex [Nitrospiraceae bacterium]|nr:redox-sensing transcriptional repressor Rex [Nitrospiraceae bacterium]